MYNKKLTYGEGLWEVPGSSPNGGQKFTYQKKKKKRLTYGLAYNSNTSRTSIAHNLEAKIFPLAVVSFFSSPHMCLS